MPLVPGESAVVTGAVLSADGALVVWLVLLSAAVGAFSGDLAIFTIGRRAGPRIIARVRRSDTGRKRVAWADDQLRRRGVTLVMAAQFVPGGRNVVMISAGALGMPWRRFLVAEAAGALLWAAFQTAIGYFAGRAFDSTLTSLVVSLGVALAVSVGLELVDRLGRRRQAGGRRSGRDCRSAGAPGSRGLKRWTPPRRVR